MVVGVIADGMASLIDLFEPIDFFLLEDASHGETMHDSAVAFHVPAGFQRVFLGFVVEIAFFIIPASLLPRGEIPAHFQVEADCDQGFVVVGSQLLLAVVAICTPGIKKSRSHEK